MTPIILFRKNRNNLEELEALLSASSAMPVVHLRTQVPADSLVIARYSALPYYRELEADLAQLGATLINTAREHEYIAGLDYAADLGDATFKTWHEFKDIPQSYRDKPFVVKGKTNSKKFQWDTKMFAKDFSTAIRVGNELLNDSMIGDQGLVIREYIPLETFEVGINGMPMSNEWRLFCYKDTILAEGFYWSIMDDMSKADVARVEYERTGIEFAITCAKKIAEKTTFFALDIARTVDGRWVAVEVNDGQMSGLNDTLDPQRLYRNLSTVLHQTQRLAAEQTLA